MKQTTKWIVGIVGAILAIGLVASAWYAKAKAGTTYHLANGIEVTPREVPRDDIAEALDAKVWKFDVVMPDDKHMVLLRLSQIGHGKLVRQLGGGNFQTNKRHCELTVIMIPVNGDIGYAQQIRFVIQSSEASKASGYFANPLRNCGGYGEDLWFTPSINRVFLIGGGRHVFSPAGNNDVDIAIDIEQGNLLH